MGKYGLDKQWVAIDICLKGLDRRYAMPFNQVLPY